MHALYKAHCTNYKNNNIFENMVSSVTIYSKNIWKSFYFPKTVFQLFFLLKTKIKNNFQLFILIYFLKIDFQKKVILF